MLGVQLAALLGGGEAGDGGDDGSAALPPGVGEALNLVDGFDTVLVHGFARIAPDRAKALAALVAALDASPLGPATAEAFAKVSAGVVTLEHLTALAAGRAAILGAVHDALLARLDTAIGRTRAPWGQTGGDGAPIATTETTATTTATSPPDLGVLSAVGGWLQEVAIVGWRGVNHELVAAADRPAAALLAEPALRRQAVLLDGLAAELRMSCPVGTSDRIPVRRWADLWARAVLLTRGAPQEPTEPVSGRLLILGVDVLEHGTAVQARVHAVLEPARGPARLVRTGVTAAKTDTVSGPAVWRLAAGFPVLLGALAEGRSLDVRDLPLSGTGHLGWIEQRAAPGERADPFATARILLSGAVAPAAAPLDRHPVQLSEPVLVEGYQITGDVLKLNGLELRVETDRLPAAGPLTPALLRASTACLGLVRWDAGRWFLRPLAVQAKVKTKITQVCGGDWALGPTDPKAAAAEAKSGDPLAVLRERSGKLLRA